MMKILYKDNSKNDFSLLELAIVILIIWLLTALTPGLSFSHRDRHNTELKYCFSNQRVLMGAIEMYNMDHTYMLDTAFPGREFDDTIKLLKDGGYLKSDLISRDNVCTYGFINVTESGNTFCVIHGACDTKNTYETDEKPYYPELDSNSQCTRIKEYEILKIQMKKESKKNLRKKELNNKLKEIFLESPNIPAFLLAIIFIIIIWNYFSDLKNKKRN